MKQHLQNVIDWVAGIDQAAHAEKNPHHRAILENYRKHVALEFCGNYDGFLGKKMAIDEPVYRTFIDGQSELYDGLQEVMRFYGMINEETVLTNHDERLAVGDWGFASYNTWNMFTNGRHLASQGITVDDQDAHYKITRPIAMFWNYTMDAKLIGEEVYQLAPPTIEKIDAADAPTWAEVRDAMRKFLAKWEAGEAVAPERETA